MKGHLRGVMLLFALTFLLCCVLYPLTVYAVAQSMFHTQANGSLMFERDASGATRVRGSRLIAASFNDDPAYFHPRPSAVGYNGAASGGSNLAASNPKLRDRVARHLGPIIRYNQKSARKNDSVQQDIESWFRDHRPGEGQPSLVVQWARANPTLATAWVKSDANKAAVLDWFQRHPQTKQQAVSDESALPFFESFAAVHPQSWPEPEVTGAPRFKAVQSGRDLQATFFDSWLRAHPNADLEAVPADMVTTSGSGLDPHISLANALSVYQLDRVALARAANPHDPSSVAQTRAAIGELVQGRSFTPLFGLVGNSLVNVLEVNSLLDERFPLRK